MPSLGRGINSRQYQVPADFVLPANCGAFDTGVFLPRDAADYDGYGNLTQMSPSGTAGCPR